MNGGNVEGMDDFVPAYIRWDDGGMYFDEHMPREEFVPRPFKPTDDEIVSVPLEIITRWRAAEQAWRDVQDELIAYERLARDEDT